MLVRRLERGGHGKRLGASNNGNYKHVRVVTYPRRRLVVDDIERCRSELSSSKCYMVAPRMPWSVHIVSWAISGIMAQPNQLNHYEKHLDFEISSFLRVVHISISHIIYTLLEAVCAPHNAADAINSAYSAFGCGVVCEPIKYKIQTRRSKRSWTGINSLFLLFFPALVEQAPLGCEGAFSDGSSSNFL